MAAPGFQLHSPLDTLVRRTSARRAQASTPGHHTHYADPPIIQTSHYDSPATPPKSYAQQHYQLSPTSPLLHSRFARDSTATASSNGNNSYLQSTRTSVESRNIYQDPELEYRYYDDESIYSNNAGPALRDSWQSSATSGTVQGKGQIANLDGIISIVNDMSISQQPSAPTTPISPVPTVIVSSPVDGIENPTFTTRAGRTPVIKPITSNFSRPVRPPVDDEQKRIVLERNARRTPSPNTQYQRQHSDPRSQVIPQLERHTASQPTPRSHSQRSRSPATIPNGRQEVPNPYVGPSSYPTPPPSQAAGVAVTMLQPAPFSVALPTQPPSLRTDSPVSLYSTYSYYQLDSASPSPTGSGFHLSPGGIQPSGSQRQASPTPTEPRRIPDSTAPVTQTAQDYLQLGIQHHEANRLKESAIYFEKSARENGGCGVGMLMWGLALRHGWGCEKNEKMGFKWLRRAAESAVEDLENARSGGGMESNAVQTELVLAIYEVGQCFFHGWGIAKDQKMAVSYYTVAARLGDPDAQSDLAFCLANGKGCKKDRKEAAKWYRAAVAQGQSDIGLAWIYKEKYQ